MALNENIRALRDLAFRQALPGAPQSRYNAKQLKKLKRETVLHYGGKCSNCEESNVEILLYVNPKTYRARYYAGNGYPILKRLKKENYPQDWKVFCPQCFASLYLRRAGNLMFFRRGMKASF